ncbi:MAG: hypothetical protein U1F30_04385 [Steroidobacteraceae bacterium]
MSATAPADLTIYDRLRWSASELEVLLASGAHRRELLAYFGTRDYLRLAALARRAAALPAGGARPRVYVIPGIMGSELGRARPAPWPADLLWVDPLDIIAGRLTELELAAQPPLEPLGVLPPTYAPLQLALRAAGCDVVMHAYDWRRSIVATGRELGARLAADPAREIHLVAHSMGGLLARVALAAAPQARVVRLITVGTPHAGSYAPLEALRGTYPVVRRLAALDRRHDAEALAASVFRQLPEPYEMRRRRPCGCALGSPGNWPHGALARARCCRPRAAWPRHPRRPTSAGSRSSGSASAPSPDSRAWAMNSPTTSPAAATARCRRAAPPRPRALPLLRSEHSELLRSRPWRARWPGSCTTATRRRCSAPRRCRSRCRCASPTASCARSAPTRSTGAALAPERGGCTCSSSTSRRVPPARAPRRP